MSHTSKFKKWYKERCGHPLGVNLGMKAVNELTEENAKLRYHLESMVGESIYLAKFKNEALKRSICSTDLDEPEWHDYQEIAEAANLLNQLKEQGE